MKNTYKSFALLCIGLAAVACVEESLEPEEGRIDTTPGNEIVFTASAGIEDGFKSNDKTKTVYGDKNETAKLIEVNWVNGDKISIVSPQATGAEVGHYQVSATNQNNGTYNGAHKASSLTRLNKDAGLQWTAEKDYNFYAVYPSVMNSTTSSFTKNGVFTGTMPKEQAYTSIEDKLDNNGEVIGKIAVPNMEYAFMTANSSYSRMKADGTQNDAPISLQFNSLATALQFDLVAGNLINVYDSVNDENVHTVDIVSISLISAAKNICGEFRYDFLPENNAPYYTSNPAAGTVSNRINMYFDNDPISLKPGEHLDVTFFILPEQIPAKDLKLQIIFKLGSTTMSRSAEINASLTGGKKYCFNNVKMEDFDWTEDVNPGSWFDTIDPTTLVSQLSIPVASNVFATTDIFGTKNAKSAQQVLDIHKLWEVGVRGFELVNRRYLQNNNPYSQYSLSGAHFVCDENVYSSNTTNFGWAFDQLAAKLYANPKEFLVVICTYQASGDGYNPDVYVKQLLNYLDNFVANNTYGFEKKDFIQITSSTTVEQAQGSIAIIIRPGDDARYETQTNSSNEVNYGNAQKKTSAISLTSYKNVDWSSNVTLIEDWGTAFDVWDRRYEGVARESTFETEYYHGSTHNPKLPQIEDWLWGISTNSNSYTNYSGYHDFNNGTDWPKKREQFLYEHGVIGSSVRKAYVQEWARIANGKVYQYTGKYNSRRYLWVNWPDSYVEKLNAIDGLFKMSVKELGKSSDNMYINSLSGYFIDTDIAAEGQYPFKKQFSPLSTSSITGQGKGGDHVGLAYKLNKYVYGILSGESTMQDGKKLDPGPWGFIMMEHIGNTTYSDDVSLKLVDLIMMNNFKVNLGSSGGNNGGNTGTEPQGPSYNASYSNGGDAISFE